MTTNEPATFLCRDSTGQFYVLSEAVLAAAKVSPALQAALEQYVADHAVAGYGSDGLGSPIAGLDVEPAVLVMMMQIGQSADNDLRALLNSMNTAKPGQTSPHRSSGVR
jgi:hypothetical protein